jgi:hypothetical protein
MGTYVLHERTFSCQPVKCPFYRSVPLDHETSRAETFARSLVAASLGSEPKPLVREFLVELGLGVTEDLGPVGLTIGVGAYCFDRTSPLGAN